jgi:hypothetical protein
MAAIATSRTFHFASHEGQCDNPLGSVCNYLMLNSMQEAKHEFVDGPATHMM